MNYYGRTLFELIIKQVFKKFLHIGNVETICIQCIIEHTSKFIPLCNYKVLLQNFREYLNKKEKKYYLSRLHYGDRMSKVGKFKGYIEFYAPLCDSNGKIKTGYDGYNGYYWRPISDSNIKNKKVYIIKNTNTHYTLDISFEVQTKKLIHEGIWNNPRIYYHYPGLVNYKLQITSEYFFYLLNIFNKYF